MGWINHKLLLIVYNFLDFLRNFKIFLPKEYLYDTLFVGV